MAVYKSKNGQHRVQVYLGRNYLGKRTRKTKTCDTKPEAIQAEHELYLFAENKKDVTTGLDWTHINLKKEH